MFTPLGTHFNEIKKNSPHFVKTTTDKIQTLRPHASDEKCLKFV